jgi:hypothetical protein
MILIVLNSENVAPALWFYSYDEDILPALVYARTEHEISK